MDELELRGLVRRFQLTGSFAEKDAKTRARALAKASPDDFLALAKEYIVVARVFEDISLSIFFLQTASDCAVCTRLMDWIGDEWDTLGDASRRFFLNAAIARPVTIPTEFLHDLFFRDSTSDLERFSIFTGMYGTWEDRECADELEIMIDSLAKSEDPEIRQRVADLGKRFRQSRTRDR